MALPLAADLLAPRFELRLNGGELLPQAEADVVEASALQDVAAPGMFALRLRNEDRETGRLTWSDHSLFSLGTAVEIRMGYGRQLRTVMDGEITGLEPELRAGEPPMLTVRGHDRRHRLMRGRKSRSFTQIQDSEIARQIAQEAGLTAEVESTRNVLEYVLQHNQTDLEFLHDRAARLGFEIVIEGRRLRFRSHANTGAAALTLTREDDLLEIDLRLSTLGQAAQVEVRAWNPKDKDAFIGQAAAGGEGTTMGGSVTGPQAVQSAFGSSVARVVDEPVFLQNEAGQIASGRLREMALGYVAGEGIAKGRPDLAAGTVIRMDGLGRRFSGLYYVTSARHSWSPRRGYRTAFTVRRNAT